MEVKLFETVVAGTFALAVPSVTYFLTKRNERRVAQHNLKLSQYQEFMDALAGIIDGESTEEAQMRFGRATNTLQLVASNRVVLALHAYREEIRVSNANRTEAKDTELLSKLVWEIRNDLGDTPTKNPSDFVVRLWASRPPSEK